MEKERGLSEEKCTGCAACANICKKDAIQMVTNRKGFLYPKVDRGKCIGCGECRAVCKACNDKPPVLPDFPCVYAMQSKNEEIRRHSTSGGIFSELAGCILGQGGGIAGAIYCEDWSVKHSIIWDFMDLEKVRRSKYQQSSIGLLYREIKTALDEKKKILFCGTPCQAAGLRAFLGKEYENLFVCDFICRGVSSPQIFAGYIEDLKRQYASEIEFVWMKNKCNGWHSLTTVIGFKNGETYVRRGLDDSYVQLYLQYNMGVRESCYECRFKGDRSVADITLGDFWGLESTEMDDNMGTSSVICHTPKGVWLLDGIRKNVLWKKMQIEDVEKGNPCLYHAIRESKADAEAFYNVLEKEGYQGALKWIQGEGSDE